MRKSLALLNGLRIHVCARIQRFGSKENKLTMILDDVIRVRSNGTWYYIANHLWVEAPRKKWNAWDMPMVGDYVEFTARVFEYERTDGSKDYSLNQLERFSRALPCTHPMGVKAA
jgi:hypothetical protein